MLSLQTLKGGTNASAYYAQDNYYAKDALGAPAWFGDALDRTANPSSQSSLLAGPAQNDQSFANLLSKLLGGETPNGQQLGRTVAGEIKHQAGIDLTFSAPKSVTIMAMLGGDKRLIHAHDSAVKATLAHVERNLVATRIWDKQTQQQRIHVGGHKMMAAIITHDLSRNMDPQLHSHCVVPNMVLSSDGRWRSLYNRPLYDHSKELGARYRTELALQATQLGYQIDAKPDAMFELRNVHSDLIEAFSTRSAEIRDALAKNFHTDTSKSAAIAAITTRSAKQHDVDRQELKTRWEATANEHKFSPEIPLPQYTHQPNLAKDAAQFAVEHVSERNSTFTRSDLFINAATHALGNIKAEDIDNAIDANKELVPSEHHQHTRKPHYTTETALARENAIIERIHSYPSSTRDARITDGDLPAHLNDGQRAAAKLIASNPDFLSAVVGYAGVGKTTMLDAVREGLQPQGIELVGLAPTASAANTLSESAQIRAGTLQGFLSKYDGYLHGRGTDHGKELVQREYANKIIVLDESSLASTRQMHDLLQIAEALQPIKIVALGDPNQLNAVEAGTPFELMLRAGVTVTAINEIIRQQNPDLRDAVYSAINGDMERAFALLGPNIHEVQPSAEKTATDLNDALARSAIAQWRTLKQQGMDAAIVAPTTEITKRVNDLIRSQTATEGKRAVNVDTLKSKHLTAAESKNARSFGQGDTVIPSRETQQLSPHKQYDVTKIHRASNKLTLRDGKRETHIDLNNPHTRLNAFQKSRISLKVGDTIRFTRNNSDLGINNADRGTITKVGRSTVQMTMEDGETKTLSHKKGDLDFVDHAHASTVHAFQGKTVDAIVAITLSDHPHLTTQNTFYTAISRARHDAVIITDDKSTLQTTLEAQTGKQLSALDAVPERSSELGLFGPTL